MRILRNVLSGLVLFASCLIGIGVAVAASFIAGAITFIVGAVVAHVIHAGPVGTTVIINNTNTNYAPEPVD